MQNLCLVEQIQTKQNLFWFFQKIPLLSEYLPYIY